MIRTQIRLVTATIAIAAAGLTACGDTATTAGTQSAVRTVAIEMRDIAFAPDTVDIQAGETIRFVFTNAGAVTHDAFIGDETAQADHEMEMRQMSGMGGSHNSMSDEGGITVEPGATREITHTFQAGSKLLIGCHEQGHYAAGMHITINMT